MAWTPPNTAIAGDPWTAADFNTYVRDNLLATEIGLAAANGVYQLSVADDNEITLVQPALGFASATVSTTSGTYVTLGSSTPAVTVTCNYAAWVSIYSWTRNSVVSGTCWAGVRLSGATTGDFNVLAQGSPAAAQLQLGAASRIIALNPGSNTFTMVYCQTNGGGTAEFAMRTLSVIPL